MPVHAPPPAHTVQNAEQKKSKAEQMDWDESIQWTTEVKRLKGHLGHDPYGQLAAMRSMLPPP